MSAESIQASRHRLTQSLIDAGHWIATGVPGVVGRSRVFEEIVRGVEERIHSVARALGAESIHFPPVLDREVIRRTAYMESFPELCGSIHSYRREHSGHADLVACVERGDDWAPLLQPMELTLCPAACYPLYPACSGVLPETGRHFSLSAWVFRSEPSDDPARLQSFRQHENVRIASPDMVREWCKAWHDRALGLLHDLGLPARIEVASDPFFGRGGRLLAANQIADERKLELVLPITSEQTPTALASINAHDDKFTRAFGIELPNGEPAHSACIGFGLERVALGLLTTHGFDPDSWPAQIRERLSL